MPDALYQVQAVLDAVAVALRTIQHTPGPGPVQALRVDVDGVDGPVVAPMALVTEGAGGGVDRYGMDDHACTAEVRVTVTCIGASLPQVRALRGRVLDKTVGGSDDARPPINATGLRVLRRRLDGGLPRPDVGGDWAQAVVPLAFEVERAS
jgi:hypothetical protein